MKKSLLVSIPALLIAGFFALPVIADQRLVRFEGGIGVIPVRGNGAPFAANVVHFVDPAGQPWVIADLRADVRVDGRIRVDGRGLLFAGGNSIGTRGGVASVRARLFCGGVAQTDTTAALDTSGDFRIDDVIIPAPPNPCVNPVLLILNPAGTAWFAAGIPRN